MSIEISVQDFAKIEKHVFILDVREPWELKKASLKKAFNCPMQDLYSQIHELPQGQIVYVLCHHGVRSLRAALYLQREGIQAISIKGGIDMYAREIDASVGFY